MTAAKVTLTEEWLDELADEFSGFPIGSGYYSTTVGASDAREIVRERLAPVIEQLVAVRVTEALQPIRIWALGDVPDLSNPATDVAAVAHRIGAYARAQGEVIQLLLEQESPPH